MIDLGYASAIVAHWYTSPAWWALAVSVLALIVAFFQNWIWEKLKRPRLSILADALDETFITYQDTDRIATKALYSRIQVCNKEGRSTAREVEVFADALWKENPASAKFEEVMEFPRMDLLWSHIGRTKQDIHGGLRKYCDVASLASDPPNTLPVRAARFRSNLSTHVRLLEIQTEIKPNHGRNILSPGNYRLRLKIASANAAPVEVTLSISFSGEWSPSVENPANVMRVEIV
jgi:hypothetical protein